MKVQEPLHRGLTRLVIKDTGTNIHRLYITCPLSNIYAAWSISKKDLGPKYRNKKLKIMAASDGYMIEIYRPETPNYITI